MDHSEERQTTLYETGAKIARELRSRGRLSVNSLNLHILLECGDDNIDISCKRTPILDRRVTEDALTAQQPRPMEDARKNRNGVGLSVAVACLGI